MRSCTSPHQRVLKLALAVELGWVIHYPHHHWSNSLISFLFHAGQPHLPEMSKTHQFKNQNNYFLALHKVLFEATCLSTHEFSYNKVTSFNKNFNTLVCLMLHQSLVHMKKRTCYYQRAPVLIISHALWRVDHGGHLIIRT